MEESIAVLMGILIKVIMKIIKGQVEESLALVDVNGREIAIAATLLTVNFMVEESIAMLMAIPMKVIM